MSSSRGSFSNLSKVNISTQEIKELVSILNRPPFDEDFTLVSFDELSGKTMKALVEKILRKLDSKVDVSLSDDSEESQAKLSDLLGVLNFSEANDPRFVQDIFEGKKAQCTSILIYVAQNFETLKQRAYLGYYLAQLYVPDEFLMDSEMKALNEEYRSLLRLFRTEHEAVSVLRTAMPDIGGLKAEVSKLESEREALDTRVRALEAKAPSTQEYLELLKAVGQQRKAQEEELRLSEKLRAQRMALEQSEHHLLIAQQKLSDAQRACGEETTAEEMLAVLQTDVANLMEVKASLGFEFSEKEARIAENERKLSEPIQTPEALAKLEAKFSAFRAMVSDLEGKVTSTRDPEKEEKLSIFRQQGSLVVKRREELKEEGKILTDERTNCELEYEERRKEFEKAHGGSQVGKTDFVKFQENLSAKLNIQRKKIAELREIESEIGILKKTAKHIQQNFLAALGMAETEGSAGPTQFDSLRDASDEKLASICEKLIQNIETNKERIKPLVEDHKALKSTLKDAEDEHRRKKADFERVVGSVKAENEDLMREFKKARDELNRKDVSVDLYKEKGAVLELVLKMLEDEKIGRSRLRDRMKTEIAENETKVQELKEKRDQIKAASSNAVNHMNAMNALKELLEVKIAVKTGKI